jgi:phospholipid/cholesterol/gamma-HCH transport system substrate-binding protein
MRWAEHGISPVKAILLSLVLFGIATYFIFTKQLPFTHHYTIRAVVNNSNLLQPGSAVRIGGVTVGSVTNTGRYRHTDLAVITMRIDDTGQEIHSDATVKIRPRLFLEGNFYVQLAPGTPSAPPLPDGGMIPGDHTAFPVQIDQLLDVFPAQLRHQLQQALQGLGQALDTVPTAGQDAHLDPRVRGVTGAQAINKTFDSSAASLRDSGLVSQALVGPPTAPLSATISGFARASRGLAQADDQLSSLISDFDRTMRATAAQQPGLRQTVRQLGPFAQNAETAFAALGTALPPTDHFSAAMASSLPQLPSTITAAYPWLAQAKPLLSSNELGGLLHELQPATSDLAALTHAELQFLPKIDAFNRCMTNVFLPTGNVVVNDGPFSSGVPNYQEFWYAMTGQAAEGQDADGNGNFLRIGASGGPFTVESGKTNYYGRNDTAFAQMPAQPVRTRPAFQNRVPALQRSVPCYTQPIPKVNGPASTGPADGSHPDGPAPAKPNDPTESSP